jgi:SAM-dependent methyltransferase
MNEPDAVEWHSRTARSFDAGYAAKGDFQERQRVLTELIRRYSRPAHSVLDIGCGSGVFSLVAAPLNASVIGIDASAAMIDLCRQKLIGCNDEALSFRVGDIRTLPEERLAPAGLVISSSLLEYLDDLDGALQTLAGLTEPGGVLIVSLPNRDSLFRRLEPLVFRLTGRPRYYRYLRNLLTAGEMTRKLERLGMTVGECRYFSRTPVLSGLLGGFGLRRYADNLFVLAARHSC